MTQFYEDDEPIEKIKAAWDRGKKGLTAPPDGVQIDGACFGREHGFALVTSTPPTTIQGNQFIKRPGVPIT